MKKYSLAIIVFMFLNVMWSAPVVVASGESWLSGWDYRQEIIVQAWDSGAGTDYQVQVNVSYLTGMQTDFDDLRFTDDDGETLLDHWIQEYVAATSAVVWVEVADDLEEGLTLFMYYGNSTVSDVSDGDAVFEFFDDFEDGSFNTSKWTVMTDYGSEFSESGGVLDIDPSADRVQIASDTSFDASGYSVHSFVTFTRMRMTGFIETTGDTTFNFVEMALFEKNDAVTNVETEDEDSRTDTVVTLDSDTWQIQKANWYNSSLVDFYVNNTLIASHSTDIPDGTPNLRAGFYVYHLDTNPEMQVEWVFVKKQVYDDPTPILGDWESFESVEFIFNFPFSTNQMWGLDLAMILLGMFLVPASTIYAVRGGLKEASTDKLFIFLMAFIFGWALIIGSVMP